MVCGLQDVQKVSMASTAIKSATVQIMDDAIRPMVPVCVNQACMGGSAISVCSSSLDFLKLLCKVGLCKTNASCIVQWFHVQDVLDGHMDLAVQLNASVFNKILSNATDVMEAVCVNLAIRAKHAAKVSWFVADGFINPNTNPQYKGIKMICFLIFGCQSVIVGTTVQDAIQNAGVHQELTAIT